MDIFRDTFGKLIFYITLISQIFTVWQGYTKDFQCAFEKALKEQVHSSESSLNNFQNFKGKNLEWSTLLAKLQLVTILKKKNLHEKSFPMALANMLRTTFLQSTCEWLLSFQLN